MPRFFRLERSDRGAAIVEFALVIPFLVLILVGMVEFGWLFSQNLNVRHGAREGARLVAVNYNPNGNSGSAQTVDIVAEICGRMDTVSGVTVGITGAGDIGDPAVATIAAPGSTITGLLDWAIPSPLTLSSSVEVRLEQTATWADTGLPAACS
ncbi:MAG: TadE/TadG family type IV pilus assembly protein [Acidimicrobiia bacterium]